MGPGNGGGQVDEVGADDLGWQVPRDDPAERHRDVVELGVGCGRYARHIRDLSSYGTAYSGSYLGIDIDAEALEWCRRHFDDRFEFVQSTHASSSYLNDRASTEAFRIPRDDASVDFVFGISVFSHLLEDTLRAGHFAGEPELVAQMVMDGPDVIRWLIRLGMLFDLEDDRPIGGRLLRKKPGGAS